jgi:hypothetical protein
MLVSWSPSWKRLTTKNLRFVAQVSILAIVKVGLIFHAGKVGVRLGNVSLTF